MRLDNGMISGRQYRRTLFLELFGSSVYAMTGLLVSKSRERCFEMLLFGGILALVLAIFYWKMAASIRELNEEKKNLLFLKLLSVVYALRFMIRGGFVLAMFYTLLEEFLLKDMSIHYIVIPLIVVCGYGVVKGRENRQRTMELLFWFVLVPFIFVLLLVVKDISLSNLTSVGKTHSQDLSGIFIVLSFLSNVEFAFFLEPVVNERDRHFKNVLVPVLLVILTNFLVLFLSVGVLGYEQCEKFRWPVLRVLQSAKVPGGFMERLDIFLVAFWVFAVFSVVSGCIVYGWELLRFGEQNINLKKKWVLMAISMLGLYVSAIYCYQLSKPLEQFVKLTMYVDIPLGIICALILYGYRKWKKRAVKAMAEAALIFLAISLFSGCGAMTDVEDWDYVLTLGVDKVESGDDKGSYVYSFGISTSKESKTEWVESDTLKNAIDKYENTHDKSLQLGHVTAILIGKQTFQNEEDFKNVLENLKKQPEIPVTTSLYGTDYFALWSMENSPEKKKTLGEYIEDLVANNMNKWQDRVALLNYYDKKEDEILTASVTPKNKLAQMKPIKLE